jgi:hypothetical protein
MNESTSGSRPIAQAEISPDSGLARSDEPAARQVGLAGNARENDAPGYPALYYAADAASLAAQEGYKRLVLADLGLLAAAALISIASQFAPPMAESWSRVVAAVLLALALLSKFTNRLRGFDSQWFDGRAVAETVKSATWRFAMHAPPFAMEGAEAALRTTLRETMEARPGLIPHLHQLPADGQQIPPSLIQLRAAPLAARKAAFLSKRIAEAVGWYAGKAAANSRAASRWFWLGMGAQGAALIVAIALVAAPQAPNLVAPFATVAAAIAAWTQFRRHDELSKSYSLAAHELAFLRSEVESARTEETFWAAVVSTEEAISREHTMWMAKRS